MAISSTYDLSVYGYDFQVHLTQFFSLYYEESPLKQCSCFITVRPRSCTYLQDCFGSHLN